jgi:hypothetical protein
MTKAYRASHKIVNLRSQVSALRQSWKLTTSCHTPAVIPESRDQQFPTKNCPDDAFPRVLRVAYGTIAAITPLRKVIDPNNCCLESGQAPRRVVESISNSTITAQILTQLKVERRRLEDMTRRCDYISRLSEPPQQQLLVNRSPTTHISLGR